MIGRLRGTLIAKRPPVLLIDVQGVSYEVEAPMSTIYELGETGTDVIVHTHLSVREDAQQLFGFASMAERDLFRVLIRINGVGGKLALAILSTIPPADFTRVVEEGDVTALTRVPGIGKKTAERLVVEMRGRTDALIASGRSDGRSLEVKPQGAPSEATDALVALGYKPAEAGRMVQKVAEAGMDSEAIIRAALRSAMR